VSFFNNSSEILQKLQILQETLNTMAADLTALTAQVAQNTSVVNSALTLIQGLAAEITAAQGDPAALAAIVSQLNSSDTALAVAVAANTPAAAPTTTPTPTATTSSAVPKQNPITTLKS
jgi:peptidoglycan hydrolase CwlO-like protein